LSLRSLARADETAEAATARVTWDDAVSRALATGSTGKVLVLRGGQKSGAATSGGEPTR